MRNASKTTSAIASATWPSSWALARTTSRPSTPRRRHLAPLVPALVDAVYDKLFRLRRHQAALRAAAVRLRGRGAGEPGGADAGPRADPVPQAAPGPLPDGAWSPRAYDAKMVATSTWSARSTRPRRARSDLDVPLVQMNALLGFVSDALTGHHPRPGPRPASEVRTVRAFNKLLWLQNDLIVRHYAG